MSEHRLDPWGWVLLIVGIGTIANALWMLVGPMHWYTDLPAGVPDTGPFNPHFVRDIGCAFLTIGAALIWAARSQEFRVPLVAIAALFLGAHALLHAYDTLRGALDHHHFWLDLPGVYLPAVLMFVASVAAARRARSTASPVLRSPHGSLAGRDRIHEEARGDSQ